MEKPITKAYKNIDFLNSTDARTLRILSEYLEPNARFRKLKIADTIVFFGSARIVDNKTANELYSQVKRTTDLENKEFVRKVKEAEVAIEMSKYYEDALTLSKMLTEWSLSLPDNNGRFVICTGGGPGIMEAANKGAKLAKGKTIGLNISIPTEQFVNNFVTSELAFEFHYFFMRKFWFIYLAKALVLFPGGFGTMDEMMEVLTLIQTGKLSKKLKIIVFGREFWKNVLNLEYLSEKGMISASDIKMFTFCDTPEEAFKELTTFLTELYL